MTMNLLRKIQYGQNWNIGFCEQTPFRLIEDKKLKSVQWLKHPYRDRWFADPFILRVTEAEIVVFVEECLIGNPKGILSELIVDRESKQLKCRHVLLELETHLSYPQILIDRGKIYVCPENGASGRLYIYEYSEGEHRLINPVCILQENLGDATIVKSDCGYYLLATRYPLLFEDALLYHSNSLFEPFTLVSDMPVEKARSCARPGGAFFYSEGQLYRPAQDCMARYGSALSIMKVGSLSEPLEEELVFRIVPNSFRYNLGIHTLNFGDGICVVDGYGYYYPFLGRIYHCISNKIKKTISRL